MKRSAQRIVLVSLIAVGALVALYPRVPVPAPLFGTPRRLQQRPLMRTPMPAGPRMPTFAPPAGSTEPMPVAPPVPGSVREPAPSLHVGPRPLPPERR